MQDWYPEDWPSRKGTGIFESIWLWLTFTGSAVTLGCSPRVRPGEGQLLPTPAINTDLTGEGWDQVSAKFHFCHVGASDLLKGETCASSVVILKNSQNKMWEFLFQDLTSGHVSLLCASA